jgi:hypothetical protein
MSDFEGLHIDEIVDTNPMVDQGQFAEAQEALARLRQAGVAGPSYRIDSPYERGPVRQSESAVESEDNSGRSS